MPVSRQTGYWQAGPGVAAAEARRWGSRPNGSDSLEPGEKVKNSPKALHEQTRRIHRSMRACSAARPSEGTPKVLVTSIDGLIRKE